jgi:site-specific DNA-methyltransferase (adenine-specific)
VPKKAPAKSKPLYRRKPPRRVASVTWQATGKAKPLYRRPAPKPAGHVTGDKWQVTGKAKAVGRESSRAVTPKPELRNPKFIAPSHFALREDGSIQVGRVTPCAPSSVGEPAAGSGVPALPKLIFSSDTPFIRLYCGNSLELLDAIAAKYPDGRFDAIFADPPYFLSNGGITCHAGKMVKVDKGDWDVSRGPELNHEFNTEWLRRCQKVLKPNGTIWVTGTHHVIFSIGYAMQQLGYKILNDIAWEKPNPPPNLSCRYFTHSTETVLWAAKNDKSKHVFNYQEMRKVTGKQMKTVWRDIAKQGIGDRISELGQNSPDARTQIPDPAPDASENNPALGSIWTIGAPGTDEKKLGKHPTQKPVALIERCLLASTREDDLVLDPFLGNGTTAVASLRLKRGCVGVELDEAHIKTAIRRLESVPQELKLD